MAISRPLLIVLAAAIAVLVGTTALRVMGGGSKESEPAPAPAAKVEPPKAQAAKPQGAKPRRRAERKSTQPARKPERPAYERARASSLRSAAAVARALADGKVVVLFFYQPGAADDDATKQAVAGVRSSGVAVFEVPIGQVADYRALMGGVGLSQAPSVVVVDRSRRARLLEGYQDPQSLAQEVADAR